MKKLRMIVTSVVVLAIVGSAFAFKAKKAQFCVNTDNTTKCTTYTTGTSLKRVASGITSYKYFPAWDGDGTACTTATNALCTGTTFLAVD